MKLNDFQKFTEMNGVSLYALHRITKIKLSDEHFAMPVNFSYKNHTSGNFGVFTEEKKVKCKVKFFNEAALQILWEEV